MRPNRVRLGAIAAWLGVIALSLDALVPIHLAFDLAHAFNAAAHRGHATAAEHDFSWRLLALVTGHNDEDAPSGGKAAAAASTTTRIVRSAVRSAPLPALPRPPLFRYRFRFAIEAPVQIAALDSAPHAAPAVAYRSRAPPIATADPTT